MSRAEQSRFLEDVRKDPHLVDEVRGLLRAPEAALQWARDKGYQLTPQDIEELLDSDRELSDNELDEAAGGAWPPV
jgi:predicted ribosomally synthesized peptide with nif11-like leader